LGYAEEIRLKIVAAIDPGLSGGLCVLNSEREILELEVMPIINKEIDTHKLSDMIFEFKNTYSIDFFILEKAMVMPYQSAQSGLTTGKGYGILLGLMASLRLSYREVAPQTWTKMLKPVKKPLNAKKGHVTKAIKERNIQEAVKMYPNVCLLGSERSKVPHLGKVDALLLAHYGLSQT
jgi:hypothetical protein